MRKPVTIIFTALTIFSGIAFAQDYPNKPIKVIVPYAPGGPSDIFGRLLFQKIAETTGKTFIIENKPGASANIGIQQVAKSNPDGYTLLLCSSAFVINPSLISNSNYDASRDFTPISLPASSPNIIVVNNAFPAKNFKDFVALIKQNPGKYDYSSPGAGTSPQLTAELLKLRANLDIQHIGYNGGGPALQAVLSNDVPMSFAVLPPTVQQIKGGKLLGLAITSLTRYPSLPDIPTVAESGYPEFEGETIQFLVAPAGTPKPIIQKLNQEVNKVLTDQDIRNKLSALGFIVNIQTPEQSALKIKTEVDKWARVIKTNNIQPD
ncbi:tripartite tricarboxylate transporter substrate binding protein [Polynucleobacter sp. CS-Odin-A6]|uniref:Bug family tripartite tricarboxylate transporter substrate binding protein n=1 Tax=Polynucleobacter sp. CS-Odin-A6 TaxID=2689106 RepID=UPI001C0AF723|nr:tripartite tricarboxylate transporter substrate binding protein [Polynucleobacter sp. CS-Odin-A6]MBU3620793.1 tripartite tricarboxylate transporter substrate binding protein [Polynucleobacter sp. CS-Odin-A6]